MTTEKKKPKPKAGRVVRLTPDLVKLIADERKDGETVPATIRRLLGHTGELVYVLPSGIYETIADARGAAVLEAIRAKKTRPDKPLRVQLPR